MIWTINSFWSITDLFHISQKYHSLFDKFWIDYQSSVRFDTVHLMKNQLRYSVKNDLMKELRNMKFDLAFRRVVQECIYGPPDLITLKYYGKEGDK